MSDQKMDYHSAGVNYDVVDPFKLHAQRAAAETEVNNWMDGYKPYSKSRGESVFLVETATGYLAHVEETLGTKNLITDAVYETTGKSHYEAIAIDTIATIVNDMITLGALPLTLAMHFAVGKSEWFQDETRVKDLINGWKKGCDLSSAVWGGGETPVLKGVIQPDASLISGSAMGVINNKEQLISCNLQDGDRIIFLESSGVHTNGLTLCRKIADGLDEGYSAKLSDGRNFGDALLDASIIYVPIIKACLEQGINLHYTAHLTGHGWRKVMRANESWHYVLEEVVPVHPVFDFIQEKANLNEEDMYGTYNMGAGFALYVAAEDVDAVMKISADAGIKAYHVGYVERSDEKKITIKPKNIVFQADSLQVR